MNYKEIKAINHIDEVFSSNMKSFGYSKVFPKSIEKIGNFEKFYKNSNSKTLKVIGNQGEVNILHDDPTMSLFSSDIDIQKVYYITKSFSWDEKGYESLKAGVENFSKADAFTDSELIFTAYEFLKNIGLENFYIEIGHTHFIEKLLDIDLLNKKDRDLLYDSIHSKNVVEIGNILNKYDISKTSKEAIKSLPKLFGSTDRIFKIVKEMSDKNEDLFEILKYLEKLIELLEIYGLDESKIKIDLSLTNKYSYYDGVIFKAYSKDFGKSIIRGGRYLINEDPFEINGIGFGFDLKNLIGVINMKKLRLESNDYTILFNESTVEAMSEISTLLRKQGYKVNQIEGSLNKDFIETVESEYVLEINEKKIKLIDKIKNTVENILLDQYIKNLKDTYIVESIH